MNSLQIHGGHQEPAPDWCGTQRLSEFAAFCDRLLEYDVRSIACIGVADGGNQWYLANRYTAAGRALHMLCIDVNLSLGFGRIARAIEQWPEITLDVILANSQTLSPDDVGRHDAGFVDGDHGEPQALRDGELLLECCSTLVGFHDINPRGWPEGIPSADAWLRTRDGRDYEELIHGDQYGIGIIYHEGVRNASVDPDANP